MWKEPRVTLGRTNPSPVSSSAGDAHTLQQTLGTSRQVIPPHPNGFVLRAPEGRPSILFIYHLIPPLQHVRAERLAFLLHLHQQTANSRHLAMLTAHSTLQALVETFPVGKQHTGPPRTVL